jgi:hypothetical protein
MANNIFVGILKMTFNSYYNLERHMGSLKLGSIDCVQGREGSKVMVEGKGLWEDWGSRREVEELSFF